MKLSRESWILLVLGTADLMSTSLWIERGLAQEANPLFHYFWSQGLPAFIAAKYAFLLGPIFLLEWARRHKPRFVLWALRSGVLAYVLLYGVGVAGINSHQKPGVDTRGHLSSRSFSGPAVTYFAIRSLRRA